jgi:pilus assembly protein CpaE
MPIDSEARLLWATDDEAHAGTLVQSAAKDLGISAQVCTPREVMNVIRPAKFDLVGIELGKEPREGIALIRQLHDRFPRLTIVAGVAESGVATLRAALEAGASDVVSIPLSQTEIHKILIKFRQAKVREASARGVAGEIITLYGVRGGLGVTTMAVNLAVQTAAVTSGSVALADLDLQRGDVATFLNLSHMESIASTSRPSRARSTRSSCTAPSPVTRAVSPCCRAPQQTGSGRDRARRGEARARAPAVAVPPRSSTPRAPSRASTLAAFSSPDRILLVTDLSIPSVRSARRFLDLLERLNVGTDRVDPSSEIVRGPVDLKDDVALARQEPIAILPRDEAAAAHAMNSGAPLNGGKPAGLALAMNALASKLVGVQPTAPARGSIFRRIFAKEASS